MKKIAGVLLLLSLAACTPLEPDYDYSSRKISKNEYEIKIVSSEPIGKAEMKRIVREKGKALCGERKFPRPRGVREDIYSRPSRHEVKSEVECVKY